MQNWISLGFLTYCLWGLLAVIGSAVWCFCYTAIDKTHYRRRFMWQVTLAILALAIFFAANHALLCWVSWALSVYLLCQLMAPTDALPASKASKRRAGISFGLAGVALFAFYALMTWSNQSPLLDSWSLSHLQSSQALLAQALLAIAILILSAQWPFHQWLLSSTNARTPVSALMHAGYINSGGILLLKCHSFLYSGCFLLKLMAVFGAFSVLLALLFERIQVDIKRKLAASTIAQMGFMLLQMGLGLLGAGLAHLVWHAAYKATAFLSANRLDRAIPVSSPTVKSRVTWLGLYGMVVGGGAYALLQPTAFLPQDTTLLITVVVMNFCYQVAAHVDGLKRLSQLGLITIGCALVGLIYAASVNLFEYGLPQAMLHQAQPLQGLYGAIFAVFTLFFWVPMFIDWCRFAQSKLGQRLFVWVLNQSQPHPSTISPLRS